MYSIFYWQLCTYLMWWCWYIFVIKCISWYTEESCVVLKILWWWQYISETSLVRYPDTWHIITHVPALGSGKVISCTSTTLVGLVVPLITRHATRVDFISVMKLFRFFVLSIRQKPYHRYDFDRNLGSLSAAGDLFRQRRLELTDSM